MREWAAVVQRVSLSPNTPNWPSESMASALLWLSLPWSSCCSLLPGHSESEDRELLKEATYDFGPVEIKPPSSLCPSLQPVPSDFFPLVTNSISAHFCFSQVLPFHTATMSQRPFAIPSLSLILSSLTSKAYGMHGLLCISLNPSEHLPSPKSHPRTFPAASVS